MKNYGQLLAKIARWMHDDGKLFVHIFAHKLLAYHFAVRDDTDWMSRHFFTGGTMPSADLLLRFQDDVRIARQWWLDGTHYARTANQWLASLDAARHRIMPIFETVYGADARLVPALADVLWRSPSCSLCRRQEWGVAHYLFDKRPGLA